MMSPSFTCETVVLQVGPSRQANTISPFIAFITSSTVIPTNTEHFADWAIEVGLADCSVAQGHSDIVVDPRVSSLRSKGLTDRKVALSNKYPVNEVIRIRVVIVIYPDLELKATLQEELYHLQHAFCASLLAHYDNVILVG